MNATAARYINQFIRNAAKNGRNVYAYTKSPQGLPIRIIRAQGENLISITGKIIPAKNYTIGEN